jgi:hypothetical protein
MPGSCAPIPLVRQWGRGRIESGSGRNGIMVLLDPAGLEQPVTQGNSQSHAHASRRQLVEGHRSLLLNPIFRIQFVESRIISGKANVETMQFWVSFVRM